jgi:hypothetical protein
MMFASCSWAHDGPDSSVNSAGSLTIDGSLSLLASAILGVDIGGRQQGATYDVVHVTSFAQLAGVLSLSLINHLLPDRADSFTLMKFASALGAFNNAANGRVNTADNLASFEVTYTGTNLVANGYQSPDTDGDGMTDYNEYLAGTDWLDARNVLRVISLTRNVSGHTVLQFAGVTAGR